MFTSDVVSARARYLRVAGRWSQGGMRERMRKVNRGRGHFKIWKIEEEEMAEEVGVEQEQSVRMKC